MTRSRKEGKEGSPKTLTLVVMRGPYVSLNDEIAFKVAIEAKRAGYAVNLFLYLDGVFNSHLMREKDFHNPGELLRWCVKKGVNVVMCSKCSDARDIEEGCAIPGIRFGQVWGDLSKMILESDKVLTFTE
jgi:sulfur relay (sulfurtransferase) complex TusBCD TusD component (DsrE family)